MSFTQIKKDWVLKARVYRLVGDIEPPLRQIRSKAIYWDEDKKDNRILRYYSTSTSPFLDEQPENVKVEHVYIRDGELVVGRTEVALQQFLSIHPDNGRIFYEVKPEEDAQGDLEYFEKRAEASDLIKGLSFDEVEAFMYSQIGDDVFKTSSKELKRDLWVIGDEDPGLVIDIIDNPDTLNKFIARKAVKHGVVKLVDNNKSIKWGKGNKKIMTIPADKTPYGALAEFFMTDDGVATKEKIVELLQDFE